MDDAFILNKDNTDSYNATENSDSISINYEKTTSDANYITYSNERINSITKDIKNTSDNNVQDIESNKMLKNDNIEVLEENKNKSLDDNKSLDNNTEVLNDGIEILDDNEVLDNDKVLNNYEEFVDSNVLDINNVLDTIQNKNNIFVSNGDNIIVNANLLNTYPNYDLIDIIQDSSNSDKNNYDLDDINVMQSSADDNNKSECDIMKELDNIQILEHIDGKIILQKKENTLSNDDSENKSIVSSENTLDIQKINLNSIKKYKLNDLQSLAEKYDIKLVKNKNGRTINKTKKELYNELSSIKNDL